MTAESKKISFNKEDGCDFHSVLKKRVGQYFQGRQLSPKANLSMYIKSFFYMSLLVLAYMTLLANMVGGLGVVALYILLGTLIAIGMMNIVHDALHNAYVSTSAGNRLLGYLMDLSGASSFYWKKEHTVDHHTFTNIIQHDADLDVPFLLRVCPNAPHRSFHRFQQWYAPLLYSMNLIRWVYYSDLKRIYHIFKSPGPGTPSHLETFFLILFKLIHISVFVVIPIVVLSVPFWQVLLGYVCLLGTMGLILTIVFQLAHIVENVAFPLPNTDGKMENSFAKHQMMTTSNFGTKSWLANFLFGGLNHQVEHHIFPHLCHIHLRQISPIVRSTALEFGVPYHENESFFSALRSHFGTLRKLGRTPQESHDQVVPKLGTSHI